jgi:hypothetical protein
VLAVLLPPVAALGNFASGGHHLKGSISAFYYTHMGNWFVGTLCALAVFFLESLAVVAFGVSWLVKGGLGLSDQ